MTVERLDAPQFYTYLDNTHQLCPTCGAPGELVQHQHSLEYSSYHVQCSNSKCACPLKTPRCTTWHKAVMLWDTRIGNPPVAAALDVSERKRERLLHAFLEIQEHMQRCDDTGLRLLVHSVIVRATEEAGK